MAPTAKPDKEINLESLKDVPHLGAVSIQKLSSIGVTTMRSLYSQMSANSLHTLTGMTPEFADEAISFVGDQLEKAKKISQRKQTGWDLYCEQKNESFIPTGVKAIDDILGDGIRAGYISEFYGENHSGKTQLAIQLALNCLIADKNNVVAYIDTENKLKINRLVEILLARGIITEEAQASEYLDRLVIWSPKNSDEQLMYIKNLAGLLDTDIPIKLVIIDSIISLFQSEYMERGVLKSKFNQVKPMMLNLMKLANIYKFVGVIINTVYKSPTPDFGADDIIPAGGNSVGHPSAYRFKLREVGSGKKHRFKIVKSPEHPQSEADFTLTDKGLEDVKA